MVNDPINDPERSSAASYTPTKKKKPPILKDTPGDIFDRDAPPPVIEPPPKTQKELKEKHEEFGKEVNIYETKVKAAAKVGKGQEDDVKEFETSKTEYERDAENLLNDYEVSIKKYNTKVNKYSDDLIKYEKDVEAFNAGTWTQAGYDKLINTSETLTKDYDLLTKDEDNTNKIHSFYENYINRNSEFLENQLPGLNNRSEEINKQFEELEETRTNLLTKRDTLIEQAKDIPPDIFTVESPGDIFDRDSPPSLIDIEEPLADKERRTEAAQSSFVVEEKSEAPERPYSQIFGSIKPPEIPTTDLQREAPFLENQLTTDEDDKAKYGPRLVDITSPGKPLDINSAWDKYKTGGTLVWDLLVANIVEEVKKTPNFNIMNFDPNSPTNPYTGLPSRAIEDPQTGYTAIDDFTKGITGRTAFAGSVVAPFSPIGGLPRAIEQGKQMRTLPGLETPPPDETIAEGVWDRYKPVEGAGVYSDFTGFGGTRVPDDWRENQPLGWLAYSSLENKAIIDQKRAEGKSPDPWAENFDLEYMQAIGKDAGNVAEGLLFLAQASFIGSLLRKGVVVGKGLPSAVKAAGGSTIALKNLPEATRELFSIGRNMVNSRRPDAVLTGQQLAAKKIYIANAERAATAEKMQEIVNRLSSLQAGKPTPGIAIRGQEIFTKKPSKEFMRKLEDELEEIMFKIRDSNLGAVTSQIRRKPNKTPAEVQALQILEDHSNKIIIRAEPLPVRPGVKSPELHSPSALSLSLPSKALDDAAQFKENVLYVEARLPGVAGTPLAEYLATKVPGSRSIYTRLYDKHGIGAAKIPDELLGIQPKDIVEFETLVNYGRGLTQTMSKDPTSNKFGIEIIEDAIKRLIRADRNSAKPGAWRNMYGLRGVIDEVDEKTGKYIIRKEPLSKWADEFWAKNSARINKLDDQMKNKNLFPKPTAGAAFIAALLKQSEGTSGAPSKSPGETPGDDPFSGRVTPGKGETPGLDPATPGGPQGPSTTQPQKPDQTIFDMPPPASPDGPPGPPGAPDGPPGPPGAPGTPGTPAIPAGSPTKPGDIGTPGGRAIKPSKIGTVKKPGKPKKPGKAGKPKKPGKQTGPGKFPGKGKPAPGPGKPGKKPGKKKRRFIDLPPQGPASVMEESEKLPKIKKRFPLKVQWKEGNKYKTYNLNTGKLREYKTPQGVGTRWGETPRETIQVIQRQDKRPNRRKVVIGDIEINIKSPQVVTAQKVSTIPNKFLLKRYNFKR